MLRGRRYLDKIKVYTKSQAADEYGALTTTFTDKGFIPCDVIQITGFRLMQYQQQGINYPIRIEMRDLGYAPAKIEWKGNEVTIRSVVPDLRTRTTIIEGFMQEAVNLYPPTTTIAVTTTIAPSTTI